MQIVLLVAGAVFIISTLAVTVRRLMKAAPHSKARAAMWGTLGQLGAVTIFLVLALQRPHSGNIFSWLILIALALAAINVVATLLIRWLSSGIKP
ncbi:hypothetical protein [Mycobacterium asiaticum]|uniref:Uncharacterized protein n=1 Tax=Mycobacterium asiaticum TaxID=1790 RepID=A0A1A3NE26_MYCAS|nr:hypothetical protein [Mycobacterium asiaticum]OBK18657.1 hypothetical protein A5636_01895 [Mycobacterium asiaticum]